MTPAPDMKQVLDKPGSCGQYENYQRPEGFPVGKQSELSKMITKMMFYRLFSHTVFSLMQFVFVKWHTI